MRSPFADRRLMARISVMSRENQEGCLWWYLNDGWYFACRYLKGWGQLPSEGDLMELLKLPKTQRGIAMKAMLWLGVDSSELLSVK